MCDHSSLCFTSSAAGRFFFKRREVGNSTSEPKMRRPAPRAAPGPAPGPVPGPAPGPEPGPKRLPYVRAMKVVLALETLGIAGVYGLYCWMDQSQDFRKTVNTRCPSVLEVYYQSNEWSGVYGARERDREAWSAKK